MQTAPYVIITPVYNESQFIGSTMESMLQQSIKPIKWVIVDDGSTDETAEIIKTYAQQHEWIRYVYREKTSGQTYFGSNVHAIMEGYGQVKDLLFGHVAILDADISLPATYYETVLGCFEHDSKLGIASGVYENLIDGKLRPVINDRRSTPKAIMVFRREVFEQIGGFLPLKYGGEDTAACVMARMNGWKTWSFSDIKVVHLRPTGLGNAGGVLRARFILGLSEYGLGSHPLFVVLKCFKRSCMEKPYVLSGIVRLYGYIYGCIKQPPRQTPADVMWFYRKEQLQRIFRGNTIPLEKKVDIGCTDSAR